MREFAQAGDFYNSLGQREREELHQALAEDIFFLEEGLQRKILALLHQVDPKLGEEVGRRNTFAAN